MCPKLIDKSQSMSATGTCLDAKSQKDGMFTSTPWRPLEWLLLPTIGRELLLPLVGSHSTNVAHARGS